MSDAKSFKRDLCPFAFVSCALHQIRKQINKHKIEKAIVFVSGGHHIRNEDGLGRIIKVKKAILHRQYNMPYLSNDIALIKLAEPVKLSYKVNSVCLPKHGDRIAPGTICYRTGIYNS